MEEIIYESPSAVLTFNKGGQIIELLWKKGTESDEYREIFSNLVEFARQHKIRYFLSDLRQRGHIPVEDLKWLDKMVLKFAEELGIRKVALINENTIFSTLYAETIKRKLKSSPIQVELFDDLGQARSWFSSEE
jgi:hypothetical protein